MRREDSRLSQCCSAGIFRGHFCNCFPHATCVESVLGSRDTAPFHVQQVGRCAARPMIYCIFQYAEGLKGIEGRPSPAEVLAVSGFCRSDEESCEWQGGHSASCLNVLRELFLRKASAAKESRPDTTEAEADQGSLCIATGSGEAIATFSWRWTWFSLGSNAKRAAGSSIHGSEGNKTSPRKVKEQALCPTGPSQQKFSQPLV